MHIMPSRLAPDGSPALSGIGLHTVAEVLQYRTVTAPDSVAFIHLLDGEFDEAKITYQTLYLAAMNIASMLVDANTSGKQVLLLFDPRFAYISALFGVFPSGAVAVPSFPPVGSRALNRLATISADAQPYLKLWMVNDG